MTPGTSAEPSHEELLEALAQTFDHAVSVVVGITDNQLSDPTPCRQWDVQTLLDHVSGVIVNMGLGVSGETLLAVADSTSAPTAPDSSVPSPNGRLQPGERADSPAMLTSAAG